MSGATDHDNEERLKQLVGEKLNLEKQLEDAVSRTRVAEEEHSKQLSEAGRNAEDKLKHLSQQLSKQTLSTETAEIEARHLKEDIRNLQLSKYSLEKQVRESELKLQLQSSAVGTRLTQVSELESMCTAICKDMSCLSDHINKLDANVQETVNVNSKLKTLCQHQQECTIKNQTIKITQLQREITDLKVASASYQANCYQRQIDSDVLLQSVQLKLDLMKKENWKLEQQAEMKRLEQEKSTQALQDSHILINKHIDASQLYQTQLNALNNKLTNSASHVENLQQMYDNAILQCKTSQELHDKLKEQVQDLVERLMKTDYKCEELSKSYSDLEKLNAQWSHKNSLLLEEIGTLEKTLIKETADMCVATECSSVDQHIQTVKVECTVQGTMTCNENLERHLGKDVAVQTITKDFLIKTMAEVDNFPASFDVKIMEQSTSADFSNQLSVISALDQSDSVSALMVNETLCGNDDYPSAGFDTHVEQSLIETSPALEHLQQEGCTENMTSSYIANAKRNTFSGTVNGCIRQQLYDGSNSFKPSLVLGDASACEAQNFEIEKVDSDEMKDFQEHSVSTRLSEDGCETEGGVDNSLANKLRIESPSTVLCVLDGMRVGNSSILFLDSSVSNCRRLEPDIGCTSLSNMCRAALTSIEASRQQKMMLSSVPVVQAVDVKTDQAQAVSMSNCELEPATTRSNNLVVTMAPVLVAQPAVRLHSTTTGQDLVMDANVTAVKTNDSLASLVISQEEEIIPSDPVSKACSLPMAVETNSTVGIFAQNKTHKQLIFKLTNEDTTGSIDCLPTQNISQVEADQAKHTASQNTTVDAVCLQNAFSSQTAASTDNYDDVTSQNVTRKCVTSLSNNVANMYVEPVKTDIVMVVPAHPVPFISNALQEVETFNRHAHTLFPERPVDYTSGGASNQIMVAKTPFTDATVSSFFDAHSNDKDAVSQQPAHGIAQCLELISSNIGKYSSNLDTSISKVTRMHFVGNEIADVNFLSDDHAVAANQANAHATLCSTSNIVSHVSRTFTSSKAQILSSIYSTKTALSSCSMLPSQTASACVDRQIPPIKTPHASIKVPSFSKISYNHQEMTAVTAVSQATSNHRTINLNAVTRCSMENVDLQACDNSFNVNTPVSPLQAFSLNFMPSSSRCTRLKTVVDVKTSSTGKPGGISGSLLLPFGNNSAENQGSLMKPCTAVSVCEVATASSRGKRPLFTCKGPLMISPRMTDDCLSPRQTFPTTTAMKLKKTSKSPDDNPLIIPVALQAASSEPTPKKIQKLEFFK